MAMSSYLLGGLIYYMLVADLHLLNVYKYNILQDLKLLWGVVKPYINIKMLLSYWLVWSVIHLPFYLGAIFCTGVLRAICLGYISILYLPFMSENVFITLPVSIWIYKKLFKEEPKQLNKMLQREKSSK